MNKELVRRADISKVISEKLSELNHKEKFYVDFKIKSNACPYCHKHVDDFDKLLYCPHCNCSFKHDNLYHCTYIEKSTGFDNDKFNFCVINSGHFQGEVSYINYFIIKDVMCFIIDF